MIEMTVDEAAPRLEELVRWVAGGREPITLTDEGRVMALLVAPRVIEDLESALAAAGGHARGAGIAADGSRNSSRLPTGSSE
ncbi:type II toxin-antitoxin system prevent-host-death family antitoxin [Streptomyces sp. NRRL S-37]|uniref:type II toxin-antitoxin system prevent-host-death family antitoxin n=1 Tax=Streptomyces sp. NRRL S-37 TaxID=1463903 RepID=UPI00131C46EC|nr:type II toxin-antitoxin system prevent-host-death family antitoxin [Streptomyces sp. NRRL S-37]